MPKASSSPRRRGSDSWLIPAFAGMTLLFTTTAWAVDWKEEKGDHFIVYYINDAAKPRDVLYKAEQYYGRVADDIGYPRYSNFWQWDNRAKVYIHPNKESFQQMSGMPAWSDGAASYNDKTLHTIEGTKDFTEKVLPHEITHLIFRDFVGFSGQVPLWMDEGVAQWEETEKRALSKRLMPLVMRDGYAWSVRELTRTDIRGEKDEKRVQAFYIQAVSLVDFLMSRYGSSRFTQFCRELRDGKGFEEALARGYAPSIESLEELEDEWKKYLS